MTTCHWCHEPVHDAAAAAGEHPCCAWWMGDLGRSRCVACGESRKARRERLDRHKRLHGKGGSSDPMCEYCRPVQSTSNERPQNSVLSASRLADGSAHPDPRSGAHSETGDKRRQGSAA